MTFVNSTDIAAYGPPRTTVLDALADAAVGTLVHLTVLPFDHPDGAWELTRGGWRPARTERVERLSLGNPASQGRNASIGTVLHTGTGYYRKTGNTATGWVSASVTTAAEQPPPTIFGSEEPGTLYTDRRPDSSTWRLDDDEWVELGGGGGAVTRAAVFGVLNAEATGGTFDYSGAGSRAFGWVSDTGSIAATGTGSSASGFAQGAGVSIVASSEGSDASGFASDGGSIAASARGATASGYAYGSALTASGKGSSASGYAYGGSIVASGSGSSVRGYAKDALSTLEAAGLGSNVLGYVASGGGITTHALSHGSLLSGYARRGGQIYSYGEAQLVGGFADTYGSDDPGVIKATVRSGFAWGMAYSGTIWAASKGSRAQGYTYQNGSAITAIGSGANASGYAAYGGVLYASGRGSFVQGGANGASSDLTATGHGAWVGGYASGGRSIAASGKAALAFGDASAADVVASADGALQFGPGTNALANSLAIGARGTGLRFCGDGVPGAPADGDMWLESDTIKVRLGGATKTVTAV